jgi:hypothetical protein
VPKGDRELEADRVITTQGRRGTFVASPALDNPESTPDRNRSQRRPVLHRSRPPQRPVPTGGYAPGGSDLAPHHQLSPPARAKRGMVGRA